MIALRTKIYAVIDGFILDAIKLSWNILLVGVTMLVMRWVLTSALLMHT